MNCRSCNGGPLTEILDLGEQYLSDFRNDDSKPSKVVLRAVICENCKLVQLDRDMPQNEMYTDNYGFKSGVNESIRNDLEDVVKCALLYNPEPTSWLDIASNDGTLLSFVPKKTLRVGFDPVTKYCDEARKNDYGDVIVDDYFHYTPEFPPFDVITSISCFYDMPNPNEFVRDVMLCLAPTGVWVIQQNYLLDTLKLGAVDNFSHEHLEYYTLLSLEPILERFGLEVSHVTLSDINGGCIRTYVTHKGVYPVQDSVEKQRTIESDYGLNNLDTYLSFAARAKQNIRDLRLLINDLRKEGKTIAILGASTRGGTIWQAAGFGKKQIMFAVERNPEKVGKQFSVIGVPIVSEAQFRATPTDYALVGPWFFGKGIMDREKEYYEKGGKFILPLPVLEVV